MAKLTRSTDVDVPIAKVDKEWTQFMFRTLIGHYQASAADVEWSPADDAKQAGVVTLEEIPGGTRVSVTVDFQGDAVAVAAHLERDLKEFKTFAETRG